MPKVKIKVGDDAPRFKMESYNAGIIDLDQLIGTQKIVLVFSRYFGCPICQLDLRDLLERYNEIETKGAKLLYITQSGEKISNEFIDNKKIGFPVIPSTKDELFAKYGLGRFSAGAAAKVLSKGKQAKKAGFEHGEYEGYEMQCPGQFVIDESGKIIHAKQDWLDISSILENL
jgi:peroxiredoxin